MAEQIPTFNGCSAGKYCSDQAVTPVGENKTPIYHRTVTTLTGQGPAYTGSKTETYIIKPAGPLGTFPTWTLAATTTDGGKTQTYTDAAGEDFKKSMGPGGNIAKNTQAQVQTTLSKGLGTNASGQTGAVLDKINPEQQKKAGVISPSVSTSNPPADAAAGNIDQAGIDKLEGAAGKYKGRTKYQQDLRYPENMNKNQDCIKFQIIKYKASRLGLSNQNPTLRTNSGTGRDILTSIVLPMPSGGISDRNSVSWGDGKLDLAATAFSGAALGFLEGGAKGAGNAAKNDINLIMGKDGKDMLGELVKAKSLESALGSSNLLSRLSGLAINESLELLFDGPQLREFSFSFKMTPRSKNEAQMVRSIIRTFKQAMSVKRSESVLLLKSPHTFRISYLTSTQDHPYLNRFKECALTNCSVNYTPDGQYMSYDDSSPDGRSMTAYELSLSFNELEPIFDDDYDKDFDGVDKKDALPFTNIGY